MVASKLVLITGAANALAVSTRTVRRYVANGSLGAVRLGQKTLRIKGRIGQAADRRPVGRWPTGLKRRQERPSLAAPCSPYVPDLGSDS